MNAEKLSKRLEMVASFVPQNARIADIGSDHAYLPVYLIKQKKAEFAIAGEVVEGPYKSAKAEVNSQNLESKISVRLANGLEALNDTDLINTISIAGMGGQLIADILAAGVDKLANVTTVILQPNVGERTLRKWLNENNFKIINEAILEENNKIYEIIIAVPGKQHLTSLELLFGPLLMKEKNSVFIEKWTRELANKKRILTNLYHAKKLNQIKILQFEQEISVISEVINENK